MSPTPRTPAQRAASQRNGAQSHGPTTPEGRRASSRNATKHGLSGSGLHLPPDMQTELASEISLFVSQFHPQTDYEHDLIRRAALGNLRARRIADTLNTLCDDRARNAIRIWDETRSSEISTLADQLPHNPQSSVPLLRRTAEGCDYLADALDSLAQSLQTHGFLDDSQSLRLLNLLGHVEPPSLKDEANPLHSLWLNLLSLQFDHNPRPLMRTTFRHFCPPKPSENPPKPSENPHSDPQISHQTHVRDFLPDPSDARADLAQFLQSQIADLEKQAEENWETYDLPSRESAPLRAAFDTSPETILLNRYLASAERLRKQALDELHRLRRDAARHREEAPTTPNISELARLRRDAAWPRRNEPEPLHTSRQNEPDLAPFSTAPSHPPTTQPARNIPQSLLSPLDNFFAPGPQTPSPVPFSIGKTS